MKKAILFTLLLASIVVICKAQTMGKLSKDTSKFASGPVFLLKMSGQPTVQCSNMTFPSEEIDQINIIKQNGDVKAYGPRARNGIITFTLKPGIKLATFEQTMSAFHIAQSNNKLPLYIDSVLTASSYLTYYELSIIKSIAIETDTETGGKYISILTTLPKPDKDEKQVTN